MGASIGAGLPFLMMGLGTARDAGLFAEQSFSVKLFEPSAPEHSRIAPWL